MDISNIDVQKFECFGFSSPKEDCWLSMLRNADGRTWKGVDFTKFEKSLADNVKSTYFKVASVAFTDIGTSFSYEASFDNGLKHWTLEIPGSSPDAIEPKDIVDLFSSDFFKRIAKRFDQVLSEALAYYKGRVQPVLEEGKLLAVDETRLEAIVYLLEDPEVRKNLRMAKYKRL